MDMLSRHERIIREEVVRLHQKYADKDLAHNAHGVWLLAGDAARMILRYDYHPFAITAAKNIVNHYIQLYRAA